MSKETKKEKIVNIKKIRIAPQEELSKWTCHLNGGSAESGVHWTPPKGAEPNWFWRKMQYLILGNKWIKK